MYPIPGGFHNDKTGLADLFKYMASGSDIEELLEDEGFCPAQCETFMTYTHAQRNRHFLFQFACASVIKLCNKMIMEYLPMIDALDDFNKDAHAGYQASLPSECNIKLANDDVGTQYVYETVKVFLAAFKRAIESEKHRYAKFYIGTSLPGLLIPYKAHHVFARLGQSKVVEKFLFNRIPAMMRTPKLAYYELLTCYGFIKLVMPRDLHRSLLDDTPGFILVGSQEKENRIGSLFHDKSLEMNIIRHLKSLGYNYFKKLGIHWPGLKNLDQLLTAFRRRWWTRRSS